MLIVVLIMDFITAFLQWEDGNKKWAIVFFILGIALAIKILITGNIY